MANLEKKWKLLSEKKTKSSKNDLPGWALNLLTNRGIVGKKEISAFWEPKYEDLLDPFVFLNTRQAVERLAKAKNNNEKIVVYGDYDVDGICATAIIFEALNKIGIQNCETYIPSREEEGYGLNESALKELEKKGAKLVIAVDCGISSKELIEGSSLDFIVCDHHVITPEKLPEKAIIIHPRMVKMDQKPQELCAAGMAFFLVLALQKKFQKEIPSGQEKWLLDLVALATICDVVPLIGQNRILAKWGILVLSKSKRVGLLELAKKANFKLEEVSSYVVGFVIGPRLNASGRLENANKSLKLVLTTDKNEASRLAAQLDQLNLERQKRCEKILAEAINDIEKTKKKEPVILLKNKSWSKGVVGIIASRLAEMYSRPAVVFEDDGENCHGSARSVEGFDITEAFAKNSDCLLKFGGHAKAAGLLLATAKFDEFSERMIKLAKKEISQEITQPILEIEAELGPNEVNEKTMDLLALFEPFGFGNKTPIFCVLDTAIANVNLVGTEQNHLKFNLQENSQISGIWFNAPKDFAIDQKGKNSELKYDIAFTLKYNIWNNRKKIDLRVIDIKKSQSVKKEWSDLIEVAQ